MTGLRTRLVAAWDARPTLVRASYVIGLEADLILAGGRLPDRPRRFERIRRVLADLWYHRPILTTNAKFDDQYTTGLLRGIRRGEAKVNDTQPTPPCPRHGPASRTTPTGKSLVAVGP